MRHTVVRWTMALALSAGVVTQAVHAAEEAQRALPTLLIKGEVVSVDTNDPTAALLKVKDRYGFETPIYVTPQAKITDGDQPATVESLTEGTAVEVEYNFDINTAKRHAVTVKAGVSTATAASVAPAAAPAADSSSSAASVEPEASEASSPETLVPDTAAPADIPEQPVETTE